MITQQDLTVKTLGEAAIPSPLNFESASFPEEGSCFVSEASGVRFNVVTNSHPKAQDEMRFEEAGPRDKIFFKPSETTAAIVTCGGLSPGLNNVIRSAFYELTENYGVEKVLGIRNGYLGLNPVEGERPILLNREFVEPIDKLGGTVLGSSRGPQDPAVMADFLRENGVDILFCIGGDGTQRGAALLQEELERRGERIAVVGIPKTIDNDIPFVRLSFGFATALDKASEVIRGIHVEARGAINGIGLVKLMGRHAGFIAAGASVVSQEVNFTLVPEIPFPLEGEDGFLKSLERRVRKRGHAVVVVAEGAGQHLFEGREEERDASGNLLSADIGYFLRDRIKEHFAKEKFPMVLKYVDPSYFVRSVPANSYDRFVCDQFGRHAVHAGMAGKTAVMIGQQHGQYINIPIPAVVSEKKRMEVGGHLWRGVLQATRQPRW